MQNSKKTFSHRKKYIVLSTENSLSIPKGRLIEWLLSLLILFSVTSCSSTIKNRIYFNDLQKDTTLRNIVTENYDLKIQKNDLLGITVASLSPDVAYYNAPQNSEAGTNGFLVDEKGDINFVKLGTLHVEGLTRKQLKDTLETQLIPWLKDAVVSVGFLNRHVTMLGAVKSQIISLPGNMTILDAIASSGDIGAGGKIDNVLVIRDTAGTKEFKRLSLKDHSIFYSPYYYLQPNDIVYVEPVKIKTQLTIPQVISYITTGISLIILLSRL
ncbi:polysaccharide export protein [Ginsengibacter hankyongi]|uniref:Polysaccharide export protein n=1 Tax=Ginsengibacter hankyongi TaxID=2607284 RepID=A0A5J5IBP7_9BACT|nr:polysaccharide biosynthesis/export family protein [Ginsengibacter hankyongi]KAA9036367.1 polysaccharide export protein [Ginsengibacter hankyongi]